MKGYFIVIEGCEGAGKSTACATVKDYFLNLGYKDEDIILTREPGGTEISEKIRKILKEDHQEKMCSKTELLLMYAARNQLVESIIKPSIEQGKIVIGDRHDLSSIAYQGAGRGIDRTLIDDIRKIVLGDFRPNLTLVLDLPPEVGLGRAQRRGELDRFEKENIDFFNRIRNCFLEEAKKDPENILVIDAAKDLETVTKSIKQVLKDKICIAG